MERSGKLVRLTCILAERAVIFLFSRGERGKGF